MDPFAQSVVPILIEDEMRSSYMDYSMSVIIGRAIPDVRDGFKPVHRRILYAMHGMGLQASKKYSKCAGVVGEVLKRLHPHGDSAVYDALVRMAQPWNLRYLLVDGQGNFGSVDGDAAAAYRYTECKMTKLAEELLIDIEEETVDFSANFDGTSEEPDVLPCRFPSLLVNGTEGIAVGMATKIPPHNLGEVIDGCVALIDDPKLPDAELMHLIPGPDFPTAGTIYGREGIREAYTTGRGRVIVRGRAEIETWENGRQAIAIDEIPFQVNKARLVESIADLVKERRIEGISGLRDESDRQGMRVVVELKRDAVAEVVLNNLYKHTALQSTFGVILLAIVNQRPRLLTLREMLLHYISHRREVVLRRSRYRLRKARERAHLLEGFLKALDIIDQIIALIRASATVGEARDGLVSKLGFSELQAQAILDMRLQRLTGMERLKLEEEYAAVMMQIAELEAILGSEVRLMEVVKQELVQVREAFADTRRTRIVEAQSELTMHDLVAEEDQVVTLSHLGYIKRCRMDEWRTQRRGGMGKRGMSTREEDFVTSLFIANTHSLMLVLTDQGMVFPLPVYEVPEASRDGRGRPIVNLAAVPEGERVKAVVSVPDLESDSLSLLFVSRHGLIKRTPLSAFRNLRQGGMRATSVADGDELMLVRVLASDDKHVMLFSRQGKCIRFKLADVPEYGRAARGNMGMQLSDDDEIVDCVLAPADAIDGDEDDAAPLPEGVEALADGVDAPVEVPVDEPAADEPAADEAGDAVEEADVAYDSMLLTVTSLGFGGRLPFQRYRLQRRYGKGILSWRTDDDTGPVVGAVEVRSIDQLMLVTDTGRVIRLGADSVPSRKTRPARGVRLMRLEAGERIVDVARLEDDEAAVVPEAAAEPGPELTPDEGDAT
jgi:DNA gyrase subunit A